MAAKKKTKKKTTKPKKTARKKPTKLKGQKPRKRLGKKAASTSSKKTIAKKTTVKKMTAKETESPGKKQDRKRNWPVSASEPLPSGPGSGSSGQSGDLQGLSRSEAADSESVDELIEEGNAFEADAVLGVEDADNADEKEVLTHEVPEDDVPGEYLDKD